ncbi:hypothetical protein SAMN05518865_11734 [Duganella sp. CF458]|uniref:hypothetical protein n=1 Tax=Duganella sp. CF458 TaxID=1884368 RepID=UPI0008E37263|nr:hypothetical protein [Duganella sp. CF458]SFG72943.1 hypothetical protein SAMN05518865_11734 [Duganella sp. CF458]
MKFNGALSIALMLSACCFARLGFAYDFENGVPLTVGAHLGEARIEAVQIRLNGRDVELAISLSNATKHPQYAGFYAVTPLFGYLGEGEEHADKTFHDLKAFQDGESLRVINTQRAYFLGQDVTHVLRKAGIGPIYSNEIHWKKLAKLPSLQNIRVENWQSQVSFGWSARIAPESMAVETVSYAALPQFGIESLDSDNFLHLVQQHCGNPEELKGLVQRAAPEETGVLAEVFQFPLPFLQMKDARITIEKPKSRWMHSRAIAAVACGYDGEIDLPSDGVIKSANNSISVLVVSLLPSAPADESRAMPTLHYEVGKVAFAEDVDHIQILSKPQVGIKVLPGGHTWPLLQLDEDGRIYAGSTAIDPVSGEPTVPFRADTRDKVLFPNDLAITPTCNGYKIRHRQSQCSLPYKSLGAPSGRSPFEALQVANIKLAASQGKVLALVTSFLSDGQTSQYHVRSIDPRTCKVSLTAKLGNPDLLVELGQSRRGGWWITGSIEQTLLTSQDGRKWKKVKLPEGLSSLVSSYVVDSKQIWLAGVLDSSDEYPNLLVYSADGGASWTNLKKNDPLLAKVPAGWLEGQKRKVAQ